MSELLGAGDITAAQLIQAVSSPLLTQLQHTLPFDCNGFISPSIFYGLPQIQILTAKYQNLFLGNLASECHDDADGRRNDSQ